MVILLFVHTAAGKDLLVFQYFPHPNVYLNFIKLCSPNEKVLPKSTSNSSSSQLLIPYRGFCMNRFQYIPAWK